MIINQQQMIFCEADNRVFMPQPIKTTDVLMQRYYILDLLSQRPFNTFELRNLSISEVSARIAELRKHLKSSGFKFSGLKIVSKKGYAYDNNGLLHKGVVTYHLIIDEQSENQLQGDLFGGYQH